MKFSRVKPRLLLASLAIAAGIVMVIVALNTAITSDESAKLPAALQSIDPVRDASQVLSQSRVFVDLATGYTGVLIINGIELPVIDIGKLENNDVPGKQISLPPTAVFEPGNYTLSFQPTDGALIEKFNTGVNTATVRYWRIVDGPGKARSFTWTFVVI